MSDAVTQQSSATAGKYLTFAVSKERYGIEILKVQELIRVPHITTVPRTPQYIKGVINLRGKIIPVMDLRSKFGIDSIPYDEKTCIMVVNVQSGEQKVSIGIIVDTVLEVLDFLPSEIETPPNYGALLDSKFIIGIGKREDNLNILIDIEKVVTDKELVAIEQMGK